MELCHGKDKGSKCPLCSYNATTIHNILSHMRAYHANEPNFCVTCGLDGCATSSRSFAGLYSHIYRHHSEYTDKRGAYSVSLNSDTCHQLVSNPSEQQSSIGSECFDSPQSVEGTYVNCVEYKLYIYATVYCSIVSMHIRLPCITFTCLLRYTIT